MINEMNGAPSKQMVINRNTLVLPALTNVNWSVEFIIIFFTFCRLVLCAESDVKVIN